MTTATAASEVTLAIPDTTALATAQAEVLNLAKAFVVDSQLSLDKAATTAVVLKGMMKDVDVLLEPAVKASDQAHKAAKGAWNKLHNPLKEAYDIYRRKMGDHVREEEQKARDEQRRKEAAARKIEEDRIAEEATQLADEGRVEEACVLVDQPICVPVAPVVKIKAAGMSTSTTWKYRYVDKSKIPRPYLIENDSLIGKTVRTHHKAAEKMIPGIEAYPDTDVSMRS